MCARDAQWLPRNACRSPQNEGRLAAPSFVPRQARIRRLRRRP
ncbi:hypothetical protein [Lysobacter gummosus]